jgi:ankyrin repeat protein
MKLIADIRADPATSITVRRRAQDVFASFFSKAFGALGLDVTHLPDQLLHTEQSIQAVLDLRHNHGHGEMPIHKIREGLIAMESVVGMFGSLAALDPIFATCKSSSNILDVWTLPLSCTSFDQPPQRQGDIRAGSEAAARTTTKLSLSSLDLAWIRFRLASRQFEVAFTPRIKKRLKKDFPGGTPAQLKMAHDLEIDVWHLHALPIGSECRSLKYITEEGTWSLDDIRRLLLNRFTLAGLLASDLDLQTQCKDALTSIGSVVNSFRHDQIVTEHEIVQAIGNMAFIAKHTFGLFPVDSDETDANDSDQGSESLSDTLKAVLTCNLVAPAKSELARPCVDYHPTYESSSTAMSQFTGRKWVFDQLQAWLASVQVKRGGQAAAAVVTADPGFGKSAIVTQLIEAAIMSRQDRCAPQFRPGSRLPAGTISAPSSQPTELAVLLALPGVELVAHHVCCALRKTGLSADEFVLNLFKSLRRNLPKQFDDECGKPSRRNTLASPKIVENPAAALGALLEAAHATAPPPPPSPSAVSGGAASTATTPKEFEQRLILIDGLDESIESTDGCTSLIGCVEQLIRGAPPWFTILCFSRNIEQVSRTLIASLEQPDLRGSDDTGSAADVVVDLSLCTSEGAMISLCHHIELEVGTEASADVAKFVDRYLDEHDKTQLAKKLDAAFEEQVLRGAALAGTNVRAALAAKSNGNFLWCTTWLHELKFSPTLAMSLGSALQGAGGGDMHLFFASGFARQFSTGSIGGIALYYEAQVRPILEVLVATYGLLSEWDMFAVLKASGMKGGILGQREYNFGDDFQRALRQLQCYLHSRHVESHEHVKYTDGGGGNGPVDSLGSPALSSTRVVQLYHASVLRWLTSSENRTQFRIQPREGHRRLAECWVDAAFRRDFCSSFPGAGSRVDLRARNDAEFTTVAAVAHYAASQLRPHTTDASIALVGVSEMGASMQEVFRSSVAAMNETGIPDKAAELLWCSAASHGVLVGAAVAVLLGLGANAAVATTQLRFGLLHACCWTGNVVGCSAILSTKKGNANQQDVFRQSPLWIAASKGYDKCVALLLKAEGIDIHTKDAQSPLCVALLNDHYKCFELLLGADGIDVALQEKYFQKMFWREAFTDYNKCAELLIQRGGIDVHSKDINGASPLSTAASKGNDLFVKLLLNIKGIDVNLRDQKGRSPLWTAARYGHDKCVELLLQPEIVDLIDRSDCQNALWIAASKGHDKCVKLLLQTHGIDVNLKNDFGQYPLKTAANNGNDKCVALLLETTEIKVNLKDKYGRSPLWIAASKGHEKCVELLLDAKGIDATLKDKLGQSPLSIAAVNGHAKCQELLRRFSSGLTLNEAKRSGCKEETGLKG